MIKLELPEKPIELTNEKESELVDEYKKNGTAVWKKDYISKVLLKMSNNKCAYSEQALNTQSAYMEIEHFMNKDEYPDLVVRWGNLLPSCKKCNVTKKSWDVVKYPIVNPLVDTPSKHLYVRAFRFYYKDKKGNNTIDAVALNDREHFVTPRSVIGFKIADNIETLFEAITNANTDRQRNIYRNKIKNLLKECGPNNVYSAVISTFILYELDTYQQLKTFLKTNNLWDNEIDEIECILKSVALPAPN